MAETVGVKHHNKFFNFIIDHKIISGLIVLVLIGGVYYEVNAMKANNTPKRYGLTQAEKGTLIVSVTGSGQVLAESQVDIKPKVSGMITDVKVKEGDKVTAGQVIAQIDSKDAQKSVRDAQLNLQSAEVALKKLQEPADNLSIIQAQNAYAQAQRDLQTLTDPPDPFDITQAQNAIDQAQRDLDQAQVSTTQQTVSDAQSLQTTLDGTYSSISNYFGDAPNIMKDLDEVQTNKSPGDNIVPYETILSNGNYMSVTTFLNDYAKAKDLYDVTFAEYEKTSRSADQATLMKLVDDTLVTEKALSQALEDARTMFSYLVDANYKGTYVTAVVDKMQPIIITDIASMNKDLDALQSSKDQIANLSQNSPINAQKSTNTVVTAQANLKEKQEALQQLLEGPKAADLATAKDKVAQAKASLENVQAGPDALDIQNERLTIQQRNNALADAQSTLADYSVKSPFDGIIATVTGVKGDNGSSGTAVATVITKQLLAQISLNEVDVAKVKIGDKATLTFDAAPDLSITGELVQIDTIGTSTQGVVNYNAKISFDTQDERIKPGMSATAAIITSVDQDVLLVPNAALKTQGTTSYVNVFDNVPANTNANATDSTAAATTTFSSLTPPQQVFVEVGAANDTSTEITGGINEGEYVVTQTFSDTTTGAAAATGAAGAVRIPGLTGGGAAAGGGFGGGGFTGRTAAGR